MRVKDDIARRGWRGASHQTGAMIKKALRAGAKPQASAFQATEAAAQYSRFFDPCILPDFTLESPIYDARDGTGSNFASIMTAKPRLRRAKL